MISRENVSEIIVAVLPPPNPEFTDEDYNYSLLDIESQLQSASLTRTVQYGLPETREPETHNESDLMSTEVRDTLNFDRHDEKRKEQVLTSKFNEEQMNVIKEINKSVEEDEGKCFYLSQR